MPLHSQAVSTLQDYVATLSARRPGAFLFPGCKLGVGISCAGGWRASEKAFRTSGVEGTPDEGGSNTLRQTFARLIYSTPAMICFVLFRSGFGAILAF